MNWYRTIKAAPLPDVSNEYPEKIWSLYMIDRIMNQETKERLDREKSRSFLGHGAWGIAYDIPSGFVEKISMDDKDFLGAKQIMEEQKTSGGPLPWVVEVHDADQIQEDNSKNPNGALYRIIMEHVAPLSEREISLFHSYFAELFMMSAEKREKTIEKMFLENEYNEKDMNFIRAISDFIQLVDIYNIPTWDIKGANIGLRNGKIVVLDLGAICKT